MQQPSSTPDDDIFSQSQPKPTQFKTHLVIIAVEWDWWIEIVVEGDIGEELGVGGGGW